MPIVDNFFLKMVKMRVFRGNKEPKRIKFNPKASEKRTAKQQKRNKKWWEASKRLGATGGRTALRLMYALYPPAAPSRPTPNRTVYFFFFSLRRSRKVPPLCLCRKAAIFFTTTLGDNPFANVFYILCSFLLFVHRQSLYRN
jgi:hypothetical protein